eukprot:SAG31_NODE_15326_length_760_cov_1.276853_3_plen_47_part_01
MLLVASSQVADADAAMQDPPPPYAVRIILGLMLYGLASIPSVSFQTT